MGRGLATARLVKETPALSARHLEKQTVWRLTLTQALAERTTPPRPTTVGLAVKAAAALNCLNIAVDHWTESDGRLDLDDLLDEAFAALGPR
nr:hypothetical protein [Saccharothrix sp. ALI-22-I]